MSLWQREGLLCGPGACQAVGSHGYLGGNPEPGLLHLATMCSQECTLLNNALVGRMHASYKRHVRSSLASYAGLRVVCHSVVKADRQCEGCLGSVFNRCGPGTFVGVVGTKLFLALGHMALHWPASWSQKEHEHIKRLSHMVCSRVVLS